jgi:hypothetical protein
VVLALFAVSSLAALAVERMGARLRSDAPAGWPASGCLSASVAPLGAQVVGGQASLCIADGGVQRTLDLERLAPGERYVEWIAYFESPSLCSFGALLYQVSNFNQPCTLVDLDGPQPHGVARDVSETAADTQGIVHVAGPIGEVNLAPRAQAWLLVAPPGWSPHPHPQPFDGALQPLARAVFDLP